MDDPIDELRIVAGAAAPAPDPMSRYLDKVRTRAYTITDGDVEALKEGGATEDEIFEQTVVAAIGEGLRRLDAAQRAIG